MEIPSFTTYTQVIDYGNGSSIFFDSVTDIIRRIIEEHYLQKYPGTAFLCTPCYPAFSFDGNLITKEMLSGYRYIIFLNFDHFGYEYYRDSIFEWIVNTGVDEVWEWQIGIMDKYPEVIRPIVKFMPVRYTSYYEQFAISQGDIRYTFVFSGNAGGRRQDILNEYSSSYIPYKVVNGISYARNAHEFKHCACMFNIHGDEGNHQEQLRICEFLCLNVPVVSEVSDINYFGELVTEIPTYQLTELYGMIYNEEISIYTNPAKKYKEMTYTDEAFEQYRNNLLNQNTAIAS